ncbi:xanthine dehydrogenase family protein molybdopterin-binding subunit [Bradyrhizobium erythrophlei]|uniref:Isoquinoline 1-oxidoreductase, beta subunit n=1 Tax=Bradyrhizobium erythrophlei TaxID=1437360 RepID=A0A1H4WUK8_9BRAD|nr:molybdopterin cofactor-binding domain-containing protein [Bradyrhizobium erythrophlei]SEC97082.1 isoquinoline 1-oxidoreductase, beta subunit [Bradyrhizobium erythrophlei]
MFFDPLAGHEVDTKTKSSRGVSRRAILSVLTAAGGGLLLGVSLPYLTGTADAASEDSFAPNAFIRIARDGQVTLVMNQVEMGQGTYTSMSMLVAEELEVDLAQIKLEHAPPDDKLYRNPRLGFQVTGGSTSVRAFWKPLRTAGAAARSMLISAAAATWEVETASCHALKGEVIHAPSGRRLAYGKLVDQASKLPVPDDVVLRDPKDFTLIGSSAKRTDAAAKVNGTAEFGIDTKVPDMKIATVAACPVIGGKLGDVDDSKATTVKGVIKVVRLDDAVAVIADHMGAARKGLQALVITWDRGPNATFSTADMALQLKEASTGPAAVAINRGDAVKAISASSRRVDAVYQLPLLAHAAMEPMNCTVHVRKDGCDVWVGTQVITRAQATAASVTGFPLDKVKVHNHLLGGGFGRRLDVDSITQAVQIAKQVDYPVKVIWTREEDTRHDVYRPYYYDKLSAGLDENGHPIAFSHRVTGSSVLARWLPPAFKDGLDRDAVEAGAGPYSFDNVLVDYVRQEPPAGLTTGWWRGVGVTHNAFMVEGFVDELAAAAGQDPVSYRRALLNNSPRAKAVLDLVAEKAGWDKPLPTGVGRGVSVVFGFGSYLAQVAEISIAKNGRVRVKRVVCAVDCGQMINPDTIKAQMEGGIIFGLSAALYGEITLKDGRVEQGNFDNYQVVRIDEAPTIEVHMIVSSEEPGGIGEPGTAAIAPAVANAIFALTGKRLRQLPIDAAQLKSG